MTLLGTLFICLGGLCVGVFLFGGGHSELAPRLASVQPFQWAALGITMLSLGVFALLKRR